MREKLNLTGKRSGMLTAVRITKYSDHHGRYWLCRCDCGNEILVLASEFNRGKRKHCGCRKKLPLLIKEEQNVHN